MADTFGLGEFLGADDSFGRRPSLTPRACAHAFLSIKEEAPVDADPIYAFDSICITRHISP
jgi:hypothetical protein